MSKITIDHTSDSIADALGMPEGGFQVFEKKAEALETKYMKLAMSNEESGFKITHVIEDLQNDFTQEEILFLASNAITGNIEARAKMTMLEEFMGKLGANSEEETKDVPFSFLGQGGEA